MPSWKLIEKLIVGTIRSFFHDTLFAIKCYVGYVGQGKPDLHRISCSDKLLDYCWPVLSVYYIEIEKHPPSEQWPLISHCDFKAVFWGWGQPYVFTPR